MSSMYVKQRRKEPRMQELIRTRCKQGQLVITDETITIELKLGGLQIKQQTLYRSSLVGIDSKLRAMSFFGLGGGINLVFRAQGAGMLIAELVKPKEAQDIG